MKNQESFDNTAMYILKMACCSSMAKYETLSEKFPLIKMKDDSIAVKTHVYISLGTIVQLWTKMMKSYDARSTGLTGEYIASQLLQVVLHYRNRFKDAKIYLYQGSEVYESPKEYAKELQEAFTVILPEICKYIPKTYFIYNNKIPGAFILAHSIQNHILTCDPILPLQTLFVSSNALEYVAMAVKMNGVIRHSTFRGSGEYRKLYANGQVITDWLYHDSKRKPFEGDYTSRISFLELFLLGILAYPSKAHIEVAGSISKQAREKIKEIVSDTTKTSVDTITQLYTDTGDDNLIKLASFWDTLAEYKSDLDSAKIAWNTDIVDYSIEKLNDTLFRNIPINLVQLCAAE